MPSRLLVAYLLLLMQLPAVAIAGGDSILKINPFERPPQSSKDDEPAAEEAKAPLPVLELRGTMAAGEYSLADIGGQILGIGQEINGYRLVAIHQRHVVLQKNDLRQTLSIDREGEDKR